MPPADPSARWQHCSRTGSPCAKPTIGSLRGAPSTATATTWPAGPALLASPGDGPALDRWQLADLTASRLRRALATMTTSGLSGIRPPPGAGTAEGLLRLVGEIPARTDRPHPGRGPDPPRRRAG